MCRGAKECRARLRASYDTIISRVHISSTTNTTDRSSGITELELSRALLYEASMNYIEEIKEKAFQSTFTEPSKVTLER